MYGRKLETRLIRFCGHLAVGLLLLGCTDRNMKFVANPALQNTTLDSAVTTNAGGTSSTTGGGGADTSGSTTSGSGSSTSGTSHPPGSSGPTTANVFDIDYEDMDWVTADLDWNDVIIAVSAQVTAQTTSTLSLSGSPATGFNITSLTAQVVTLSFTRNANCSHTTYFYVLNTDGTKSSTFQHDDGDANEPDTLTANFAVGSKLVLWIQNHDYCAVGANGATLPANYLNQGYTVGVGGLVGVPFKVTTEPL